MKPGLSDLANFHLKQLLLQSDFESTIVIKKHSFRGSIGLGDLYGVGNDVDGIHLRGPGGRHLYTQSVINILRECGLQISRHWPYSSSTGSLPSLKNTGTRHSPNDHTNCEQAQYQQRRAKAACSTTDIIRTKNTQHSPVFLKRGSINDFYYSRNIFDTFNCVNNAGN